MRTLSWLPVIIAGGLLAMPAMAQSNLSESNIRGAAPKAPRATRSEPPPVAIPGAQSRPDSAAPADRAASDLPPTEALFDAINRGDIATARDAISRGADLDGTNLLGLTPLELSVDLGRNDLSFLLLSLRGGGSSSSQRNGPPPQEAVAPPTAADRRRAAAEARAQERSRAVAARQQVASPPAPRAPTLFAGNGGSAIPAAGFLGFDQRR